MKTIYLMRHGETDWNREMRLQGQRDIPLNETGRQQAAAAGERFRAAGLHFDRVISSTLCRAMETAALVTGLSAEKIAGEPRIIEMGFGPYDGQRYDMLGSSIWDFMREPTRHPRPDGMETEEAMTARFCGFLESLREDPREETVLIVTHGVAIRTLIFLLGNQRDPSAWSMPIDNCVLYQTTLENGVFSIPQRVELP